MNLLVKFQVMPKIVCLSDTHNSNQRISVPDGDILIHAGDATFHGTADEIRRFNAWFSGLPHKNKIFVAGNHDWLFETDRKQAEDLLDPRIIYLQDSSAEIDGLKIYGSPWQPRFFEWAFQADRGPDIAEKWKLIPDGLDILITHGPPFGILDCTQDGDNAGCEELQKKITQLQPRAHIFGHIHEGYGATESAGTRFVNASNCDERYRPKNPPIVIEL
jgi:Icc-related predicted phosphoesterase